jgi:predicted AAA+ superfamily ATPase
MERALTKELKAWKKKKHRKPLILKGVRQVGKTYLLKEFGETSFPRTHYFNFEADESLNKIFQANLTPSRILEDLSFKLDTLINIKEDLIIFDEIQACPKALTSLKYFCEDLPEAAICCAGSLLGVHLGEASYPVGKVDSLTLYPMTFFEFLKAIHEERSIHALERLSQGEDPSTLIHEHLWTLTKHYFVVGGLPEVVATYAENKENLFLAMTSVRKKQEELIHAYQADMAKHAGKVNAMHLDRLWRSVPSQLARTSDGSSSKFRFKGVLPGISQYSRMASAIDWLEAAGLVHKIAIVNRGEIPFSAYAKESIFKLFLFDIGILGALSRLPPQSILDYDYGSYKGYFAENYIAQELLSLGFEFLFCWEEKTAELEFLLEVQGAVVPVEVKAGNRTKSKSLKVFVEKYQPKSRVIFSACPKQFDEKNGVYKCPLYASGFFHSFFSGEQI